ncbi:MAG: hypothetical protein A2X34_10110 [Elusimicrobia bacterium GWC2_51_8]|nr:MAG: hypothetical protein A2X33_04280 [Elusimicrobia bacterium GWA2_51_34]OGR58189.1 MAG: hypothetical protein A2X34_10110 [Elusimicrobia bacterium GWC2_51_8]HCE97552.1 hypothetical protein [Elusimicrobiota bacterium]
MKTLEILFIALGLSMDAFAVAVAGGATMKKLHIPRALKMGFFFGGFQVIMPALGWLAGFRLKNYISGFDHWVAFGLLGFIGGKMIYESFEMEEEQNCAGKPSPFDTGTLTMLSIATSIDALAVGLTFSMLTVSIAGPALIIGLVTFIVSIFGVALGSKVGHFFEKRIEALGGLILIAIGLKILFEHLAVF